MLFKLLVSILLIFSSASITNSNSTKENVKQEIFTPDKKKAGSLNWLFFGPTSIDGKILVSSANEPIYINLSNFVGNVFDEFEYRIRIYEGDVVKQTILEKGSAFKGNVYTIRYNQPFTRNGQSKYISLVFDLNNTNITGVTTQNLLIGSRTVTGYSNSSEVTKTYKSAIPIETNFTMKEKIADATVSYVYETVTTTSIKPVVHEYSRYVEFPNLSLFIQTDNENLLNDIYVAKLSLYNVEFPGTDLYYNSSARAYEVELPLFRKGKYFYIENENRFYQDKYTGAIYENKKSTAGKVLHPFFIPINAILKFDYIYYSIDFQHIGFMDNHYLVYGKLYINRSIVDSTSSQFYYTAVKTPLANVEYEQ